MFVDSVKINVKAGDGGKGCKSLYRDKYSRMGVPDGGNGGRGADIIVKADRNLHTLLDFQFNKHFKGAHGGHGSGNNKRGRDALPVIIFVPCGTVITDASNGCVLRDLEKDKDELIVVTGGKGGIGNHHNHEVTPGEPGEQKDIILDLKIIADVGVVGYPNAGKSTLISSVSGARPKIASYPFSTKFPILGVVNTGEKQFVIADIPGLIEGSSGGRGLGDKFLRHIERTRILIHLIDMSGWEGRDPLNDYKVINKELSNYSKEVARKPQILVANKMDLDGASENLIKFKKSVKKRIYPISALKKEGLEELIAGIKKKL